MNLIQVGNMILAAGAPASVAFTILYGLLSRWRLTEPGRAVFWLSASISSILILYVLIVFGGPDYPGREIVRIVVYGGVTAALWRMLYVLVKQQLKSRRHTRERTRGGGQLR